MNVSAFQPRPAAKMTVAIHTLLRPLSKRFLLRDHAIYDPRKRFKQHARIENVCFSWIEEEVSERLLQKIEFLVPSGECAAWELKDKSVNVSRLLEFGSTHALYVADVDYLLSMQGFGQEGFLFADGRLNVMLVMGGRGSLAILLARFAAEATARSTIGSFRGWELDLKHPEALSLDAFPSLNSFSAGYQFICRDACESDIAA